MKNVKNFLLTAILLLSIVCYSQQSANPLANTEWNGIANIPSPEEITFKFSNDTIDLVFSGNVVEKMKYSFKDQETIKLFKIEGNSPCDSTEEGFYKFLIKNDTLTFTNVEDACMARQMAFYGNVYKKAATVTTSK